VSLTVTPFVRKLAVGPRTTHDRGAGMKKSEEGSEGRSLHFLQVCLSRLSGSESDQTGLSCEDSAAKPGTPQKETTLWPRWWVSARRREELAS
jgi:hypothetical protein